MRRLDLYDYRKPAELCRAEGAAGAVELALAGAVRDIEDKLARLGLAIRAAEPHDWERVEAFFRTRLSPASAAALGPYDLYRVFLFGRPLLLEDGQGRLMGYFLEQTYDDPARTSYCVSLAVAASLAGNRLGADLITSAGVMARAAGARVQRAIVSPLNLASTVTFLNHCGHLAEDFDPSLKGYGEPRFAICCPLPGRGLLANRVDLEGARRFVATGAAGVDFLLIRWDDLAGLERAYREHGLRVVAALPAGLVAPEPHYLAVDQARLTPPRA